MNSCGNTKKWERAEWLALAPIKPGTAHQTRAKALYSDIGMYFLVGCEDRRLTCTITEDLGDLFNEDVVEVFIQPSEAHPVYFEYEILPLGFEMPNSTVEIEIQVIHIDTFDQGYDIH